MLVAYIAHPVSGDIKGNIEKISQIVKNINLQEPFTIPFVPYMADLLALDDSNLEERTRGIKNDSYILESGFVDEIRLYGNKISVGMKVEINIALRKEIPIVAFTKETKIELTKILKK